MGKRDTNAVLACFRRNPEWSGVFCEGGAWRLPSRDYDSVSDLPFWFINGCASFTGSAIDPLIGESGPMHDRPVRVLDSVQKGPYDLGLPLPGPATQVQVS